jgi:hypothetical protein
MFKAAFRSRSISKPQPQVMRRTASGMSWRVPHAEQVLLDGKNLSTTST